MVDASGAKSTDMIAPEDVHQLSAKCLKAAEGWAGTAGRLWEERFDACASCSGCREVKKPASLGA
jgi:hypothetical protein